MVIEINSASNATLPNSKATKPGAEASVAEVTQAASADSNSLNTAEEPLVSESRQSLKELEATVSNINESVQNTQRSIQFSIAEKTGNTIIQVFNTETDELIREIPSKELQKVAEAIEAQLNEGEGVGVLFEASI